MEGMPAPKNTEKTQENPAEELRDSGDLDPEMMSATVEAAEILEQKEEYLDDRKARNIIEYATGRIFDFFRRGTGYVFDESVRRGVNLWFSREEKKIAQDPRSREIKYFESGPVDAHNTIMYIPGQFDDAVKERTDSIHTRCDLGRSERWVSIDTLYSARKISRVREIIEELKTYLTKRLEEGGRVILLGYSCGGLIGKVLADELSAVYPGRVSLIVHNAPLDPENGFFVRNASIQELQRQIGFTSRYKQDYPFVVLGGSEDVIVPCQKCIVHPEGDPVKVKPIPGGHPVAKNVPLIGNGFETCLDSDKAVEKIRVAVRAAEIRMSALDSSQKQRAVV